METAGQDESFFLGNVWFHDIVPVILQDDNRMEYIDGLSEYCKTGDTEALTKLFLKEQEVYRQQVLKFLE